MDNNEEFKHNLKKGWEFQKYIENNFFPNPIYSIVHRTSHHEESQTLNDKLPDYIVKANYCGKEFAIECKYRSKYFLEDKILKDPQKSHFERLRDEGGMEIFVVLGLCGQPSTPDKIFVLPFQNSVFKFPVFRLDYLMEFERHGRNYFVYDNGQLY